MATLEEIRTTLFSDDTLRSKVTAQTVLSAYDIVQTSPTAAQNAYFSAVINSPDAFGRQAFYAVLAANSASTLSAIQGASDSTIKTNVDAITPILVNALAGV